MRAAAIALGDECRHVACSSPTSAPARRWRRQPLHVPGRRLRLQRGGADHRDLSLEPLRVRVARPPRERLSDLTSDLSIVSLHRLLPDDLGGDLPAVDQTFSGFGNGSAATTAAADDLSGRPEAFQRFLSRIGAHPGRPTLDLIHTELPHVPWNYLPSGQEYVTDDKGVPGTTKDAWGSDTRLITQGQQRYLLQVGYADTLLGRLLDRLRATGRYDRSLVIVTADHGVAFQPEVSRRAVSASTFEQIADVPLFIKAPEQHQGAIDESAARNVDIVPTIADHLGSPLGWRTDGRSLRDPATGGDEPLPCSRSTAPRSRCRSPSSSGGATLCSAAWPRPSARTITGAACSPPARTSVWSGEPSTECPPHPPCARKRSSTTRERSPRWTGGRPGSPGLPRRPHQRAGRVAPARDGAERADRGGDHVLFGRRAPRGSTR